MLKNRSQGLFRKYHNFKKLVFHKLSMYFGEGKRKDFKWSIIFVIYLYGHSYTTDKGFLETFKSYAHNHSI